MWNRAGNIPILIDTKDEGYHLTSAANGVKFDLANTGPYQSAWTDPRYSNAFLALDRNHNGKIDNGGELFGNHTAQPKSSDPNGYLALKEFDLNHDGVIDAKDAIYFSLLLWTDENHNGVSEPEELLTSLNRSTPLQFLQATRTHHH